MTQLAEFRTALNLTQPQLAALLNTSERAIQIVESGSDFGLKIPLRLAQWLNISNGEALNLCCSLLDGDEMKALIAVARERLGTGGSNGTQSTGNRLSRTALPKIEAVARGASDVHAIGNCGSDAQAETRVPDQSGNRVARGKRRTSGVVGLD
jgi:transcriptional regulator with XRE-family HTH domain